MPTKSAEFTAKLVAALPAAVAAAAQASESVTDGGTCNMDTPFLTLPRGMRSHGIVAACAAAGVSAAETRWMGIRGMFLFIGTGWQAARRTAGAEAATKLLCAAGFDVLTWYQMD